MSINISIDIIPSVSSPTNLSISLLKNVLSKIFNKNIIKFFNNFLLFNLI